MGDKEFGTQLKLDVQTSGAVDGMAGRESRCRVQPAHRRGRSRQRLRSSCGCSGASGFGHGSGCDDLSRRTLSAARKRVLDGGASDIRERVTGPLYSLIGVTSARRDAQGAREWVNCLNWIDC